MSSSKVLTQLSLGYYMLQTYFKCYTHIIILWWLSGRASDIISIHLDKNNQKINPYSKNLLRFFELVSRPKFALTWNIKIKFQTLRRISLGFDKQRSFYKIGNLDRLYIHISLLMHFSVCLSLFPSLSLSFSLTLSLFLSLSLSLSLSLFLFKLICNLFLNSRMKLFNACLPAYT